MQQPSAHEAQIKRSWFATIVYIQLMHSTYYFAQFTLLALFMGHSYNGKSV